MLVVGVGGVISAALGKRCSSTQKFFISVRFMTRLKSCLSCQGLTDCMLVVGGGGVASSSLVCGPVLGSGGTSRSAEADPGTGRGLARGTTGGLAADLPTLLGLPAVRVGRSEPTQDWMDRLSPPAGGAPATEAARRPARGWRGAAGTRSGARTSERT